jgi:hypothetical protein
MVTPLAGRRVELQRLSRGRWVRVRRLPLARSSLGGAYQATFVVRTRKLRLRVAVPAATAAPCYSAATTKAFTS